LSSGPEDAAGCRSSLPRRRGGPWWGVRPSVSSQRTACISVSKSAGLGEKSGREDYLCAHMVWPSLPSSLRLLYTATAAAALCFTSIMPSFLLLPPRPPRPPPLCVRNRPGPSSSSSRIWTIAVASSSDDSTPRRGLHKVR